MNFNEVVTLIKVNEDNYDEFGNPIPSIDKLELLCIEKSISRYEFYSAGNYGMKPRYILSIHDFEYDGQEKVIYKNQELHVLKTYKIDGLIELTVGEKVG